MREYRGVIHCVETYLFYVRDRRRFCLDELVIYNRETLSVVTHKWSEIIGTYNTSDTIVRYRRTKYVIK